MSALRSLLSQEGFLKHQASQSRKTLRIQAGSYPETNSTSTEKRLGVPSLSYSYHFFLGLVVFKFIRMEVLWTILCIGTSNFLNTISLVRPSRDIWQHR